MDVRKADFAGSWYPAESKACEREIQTFLGEGKHTALLGSEFVGGIVPHAGWYYSGSIACNVIHTLSRGTAPEVIMVFGMHLHPDSDLYIMADGAWETPFGQLRSTANWQKGSWNASIFKWKPAGITIRTTPSSCSCRSLSICFRM